MMGTSACCSTVGSTTPGMLSISCLTSLANCRRRVRLAGSLSGPKSLMATAARVPESMWSMRCEIGWPICTAIPGILAKSLRRAASNSALVRLGSPFSSGLSMSMETSISAPSTPMACSDSSARPCCRPTATTSGCDNKTSSIWRPSWFDSSKFVPGRVLAPSVSEPSLNSGRKLRPMYGMKHKATTSIPAAARPTWCGWSITQLRIGR